MRASLAVYLLVLGCCGASTIAHAEECSQALEERLKNIALGAYMSGDLKRLHEAEARIARVKEARARQSDCDVLAQLDVLDPTQVEEIACDRDEPAAHPNDRSIQWEKAGIDVARLYLSVIESSLDLVQRCNEAYPDEAECRAEAATQYKDRMNYTSLMTFVESEAEAEESAFLEDTYNPMFSAMRAKIMSKSECNATANRLRSEIPPSREDLERMLKSRR